MKDNITERIFVNFGKHRKFIARQELFNSKGKRLNVLFLPWHAGVKPYSWLIQRLVGKNQAVVVYFFADEILSASAASVRDFYKQIEKEIPIRLSKIRGTYKYSQVRLIGISLGNVALGVVANVWHDFDSVIQVCTASSLAKSVWEGDRTVDIRHILETNNYSLGNIESSWKDVEPINNIEVFSNKPMTIVVSKTDTSIPSHLQWNYVNDARAIGLRPKVKTSRLGHYGTIIKFCLIGKV
jgi:hypothetical protein